jgi:serine/threonine-protein kinase
LGERLSGLRAGRVGAVIKGKWRIDARIGSGGMATVYAATSTTGERGALKMLHTQLSRDESTKARFLREGYVANAINHPGVVRVLEDGEAEDGAAFLVLELLEGETMEARRERLGGALPIDMALDVADQTLDALAAAHDKGIVHRDLKPDNVFLTDGGRVKLLDFGLARMKDAKGEATAAGVTIGTPEFMPPEQALGKSAQVDARSDVWGLGAMLFTAITGKYVHEAETLHQQLIASATQRARPIRSLAPHVPPGVGFVIDKALELERDDRWPSAREMQSAFRDARGRVANEFLVDSLTVPVSPTAVSNLPIPSRREAADDLASVDSEEVTTLHPSNAGPDSADSIEVTELVGSRAPAPPPSAAVTTPRMQQPPETPTYALSPEEVRAFAGRHVSPQAPFPSARAQPVQFSTTQRVHPGAPHPIGPRPSQPTTPPSHASGSMPKVVPPERMGARVLVFLAIALFFFVAALGVYALRRGGPPR